MHSIFSIAKKKLHKLAFAANETCGGHITDEFKEKASRYIAESDNTQPSRNDPLFRQYISCLEGPIAE